MSEGSRKTNGENNRRWDTFYTASKCGKIKKRQIDEENPYKFGVNQSQKAKQDATIRGMRDFFFLLLKEV